MVHCSRRDTPAVMRRRQRSPFFRLRDESGIRRRPFPRRLLSRTVWHFLRHCGKATCEVTWRRNGLEIPCLYSISSLACSSFALPCQNARRRGYSVGEFGVDPELLPSRESNRSIQNGEARRELRSHSVFARTRF